MKIPLKIKIKKYVATLLGMGACAVILSCVTNGGHPKGTVEVTPNGILIHPTIQLSAADVQSLDNTLKNFNKSLYKIVTLQKGRVTQNSGRLADAETDATLKSEVANAERTVDVYTEQFVLHIQSVAVMGTRESKELIKSVQPILDKYH